MRIRKRTLDLSALFLLCLGLGLVAFRFSNTFQMVVLSLIGRGRPCSLRDLGSGPSVKEHFARLDQLRRQVRQVRQDKDGLQLWETPEGPFWMPADTVVLLAHLLAEQKDEIYGSGQSGVRPGDVVLDCGAHIGIFTKEALRQGAKLVVAIEPAPENVTCLRRNLEKEIAAGRVKIVEKGVWNREGELPFNGSAQRSAGGTFMGEEGPALPKLPLTTIDKLAGDLSLERVDFIKMDIEGAEEKALEGAAGIISRFHPRLAIAAYHKENDVRLIHSLVIPRWPGYKWLCYQCWVRDSRVIPEVIQFY